MMEMQRRVRYEKQITALRDEVARMQEKCHALANDHTLMVKAMRDKDAEIERLQQRVKTLEFGGEMILGIADSSRDTVKWALERLKEQDTEKDAKIETLSKAVDSWKACNTSARQERDEAREAARTFYFGSKWQTQGTAAISRYPWLEDTD